MKVNMHIHTKHSDGNNSLEEIIDLVKENKLNYFSITDHDNLESAFKLENSSLNGYINGVEITSYLDKNYMRLNQAHTVHILAYDFDVTEMSYHLLNWKQSREKVMLEFVIDYNKKYNTNLTVTNKRSIVEKELIELGICKDKREAYNLVSEFTNYKISIPSIREVIDAIHQTNGFAIWAHPFEVINYNTKYELNKNQLESILDTMLEVNIDGLESEYYIYSKKQKDYLNELINKNKLLYSIGSDYHAREEDVLVFETNIKENFFLNKLDEKRINNQFIKLTNGRSGSIVYRDDNYVYKEVNSNQELIFKLLKAFDDNNFKYHQSLVETKDNYNKFRYIKGYIPNDIGRTTNDEFYQVMKILREFHDISRTITNNKDVVCHGDLSPNNIIFNENNIVGIIDYDSLYIGSKFDDIAYVIFTWLDIGDYYRDFNELIPVMKEGLKVYGLNGDEYTNFSKKLLVRANKIVEILDLKSPWYEITLSWSNSVKERVLKYQDNIKELIG